MIKTFFFGDINLQLWEYIMIPMLVMIIIGISVFIRNQNIGRHPEYRYYVLGVTGKVFGGLAFCLIYLLYYGGGDTISYYETSYAIVNLFYKSPGDALTVLFSEPSDELVYLFDSSTGYPLWYIWKNPNTYMVVRIITPFLIVTGKSYFLSTILIAWAGFIATWRLYRIFAELYRSISYEMALAFLFVPSVLFWGGGISKDALTLAATCWFVVGFYEMVVVRRKVIQNLVTLLLASFVLLSIKPYIFICLFPGVMIWYLSTRAQKMSSRLLKSFLMPFLYGFIPVLALAVMVVFDDLLGEYSLDQIITKASVTQADLKQDYYEGNSYDIGDIDPTPIGFLSKAPIAIVSGLFRPFLFEVRNAVMLVSAMETTTLLVLVLLYIYRTGLFRFIRLLMNDPQLFFMYSFSILFSFALGLTTPNFGALVRFKIPMLPFFVAGTFVISYHVRRRKQQMAKALKVRRIRAQKAEQSAARVRMQGKFDPNK